MKTEYLRRAGENLIVYFAGWGTAPSVVEHLSLPENYDLLICYDYQDLNCDFDFSVYQHIRVVAWSMGVWVAERVMQGYRLLSAMKRFVKYLFIFMDAFSIKNFNF